MPFFAHLRRLWPLWLVVILIAAGRAIWWYTDLAWFRSLGQAPLYTTRFGASATLWAIGALASGALLLVNLRASASCVLPRWADPDQDAPPAGVWLWRALPLLGVLAALGVGWWCQRLWPEWLAARFAVAEGTTDPVFGRDASFYMLVLPLWTELQRRALWVVLGLWVAVYLRYVELPDFGAEETRINLDAIPPAGLQHLARLSAVLLVVVAWGFVLTRYRLVCTTRGGVLAGIGYTDEHLRLPLILAMTGVAIAVAGWLLWRSRRLQAKRLFTVLAVFAGMVGLAGAAPAVYQRVVVSPNEAVLERPYIERCLAASRHALGLESLTVREASIPEATLNPVAAQSATSDLPLWSTRELSEQLVATEALRTYYSFNSVDIDRYALAGRMQPLGLMVREMQTDRLEPAANTWINRTTVYTHGYGLVAARAAQGSSARPDLVISGLPVRSAPELPLTRPEIYYGETPADFCVTGLRGANSAPEFDFPTGSSTRYTVYAGTGGVAIGGFWSRLAWAIRLRSVNLLLSRSVGPQSHLHWRRPVAERLEALAPFLDYDSDPYPVLDGGRLQWIADACTVSGRFPYGWSFPLHYARALTADQPEQYSRLACNYARNSVKAVVDAYDGTVRFQAVGSPCAILRTWARAFPTLLAASPTPASLAAHWRYPSDLFVLQARAVARFHMTDPLVFYGAEDLWDMALEEATSYQPDQAGTFDFAEQHERMLPYYLPLALPGEATRGFRLMTAYTPAASKEARTSRDNLTAWLTADCDPATYGRLTLVTYPKGSLVLGPLQVEALINQDPIISEQLTLWGQQGSQVLRGRLIVLPVANSLLYIEPLYLTAERRGALPELQRIVVVFGDKVAMAPRLDQALAAALSGKSAQADDGRAARLLKLAQDAWSQAEGARQAGDLVAYGAALERLSTALRTTGSAVPSEH